MMDIKKIVEQHRAEKEAGKVKVDEVKKAAADQTAAFRQTFTDLIKSDAEPVFRDCAAQLEEMNFKADVEYREGDGPSLTLSFETNAGPPNSAFMLRANAREEKVEHVSYIDQRPGAINGIARLSFGLQSIDKTKLEERLRVFVAEVLKARDA